MPKPRPTVLPIRSLLEHPNLQGKRVWQLCISKVSEDQHNFCGFLTDEGREHFWSGKPCCKSDKYDPDCWHVLTQCDTAGSGGACFGSHTQGTGTFHYLDGSSVRIFRHPKPARWISLNHLKFHSIYSKITRNKYMTTVADETGTCG